MRRLLGLASVLTVAFSVATPAAMATPQRPAVRATTAPGSFGIRLVDVPVSAAADSRAWRYIVDFVHPGTEIRRRIAVQNNTPKAAVVRVYAGTATITHGEFVGGARQATSDLTAWTSVSHPVLKLAPWATAMDLVTIRVSPYASPGERYGVVWAQESSRASSASHLGIIEVNRVGVRIYLDVGPGGLPPTRFAITAITGGRTPGGSPEVVVSVRNTGQRAIDVGGTVSLSDGPGNFSSGLFAFQPGLTLAPGQSGQLTAVLAKTTPAGQWQANVTLRSGETMVKAHATIQLAAVQAAALALSGRTLFAGGLLAIIALVIAWPAGRKLWMARR